MKRKSTSLLALLLCIVLFVLPSLPTANQVSAAKPPTATPVPPPSTINSIIPKPVSVTATGGTFTLPSTADIYVNPNTAEMIAIGQYLANKLNPSTGYGLTVIGTTSTPPNGNIYLTTAGG